MNRTLKKGRRLFQIALAALFLLSVHTSRAQQTSQQPGSAGKQPGSGTTAGSAGKQSGSGTTAGGAPQQPGAGPQIHELSLAQAVDYATNNSVLVKNALLDYQIQEQSNRATTSQALPQITANLGLTDYIQIPTTLIPGEFVNQPGTFIPLKFGTQYNATGGITLKQVLLRRPGLRRTTGPPGLAGVLSPENGDHRPAGPGKSPQDLLPAADQQNPGRPDRSQYNQPERTAA